MIKKLPDEFFQNLQDTLRVLCVIFVTYKNFIVPM